MLVLWSAAFGAVCVVEYFRPVLQPFALQHFKGITTLSGWMSNLLGSQLTIIGIVFPLVVGLISVLFQKNQQGCIFSQHINFIPDICLLV
jgi:hypothetical protein